MSINSINIESAFYSVICLCIGLQVITAQIGKYPGVTTDDCGIGFEPLKFDDSCFLFNKIHDKDSELLNGRTAMPDEMPFVFLIIVWAKSSFNYIGYKSCLGTALNDKWIITGQTCEQKLCDKDLGCESIQYVVYPGVKNFPQALFEPKTFIATDVFNISSNGVNLLLLAFNSPITIGNNKPIRTVCLPENGIANTKDQYALITGYGVVEQMDPKLKSLKPNVTETIEIGWVKLNDSKTDLAVHQPIPYNGRPGCIGSAGSPLIQYVDNRAVLIGVYPDETSITDLCYRKDWEANRFVFARISDFIDTIIKTIK